MCGSKPPATTITQPDYGAYDRLTGNQLQLMQLQQSSKVMAAQEGINTATLQQQQVMEQLRDAKLQQAQNTTATAGRLAALIGAPVPDRSATAPVLGDNRTGMTRPMGNRGLRIDRQSNLNLGQ
jgi:pSer/pThr/pTyr-binding forkhead associated (FHA) protein